LAASDVAAAELKGRYYVVGGYTGTQSLSTIVEWRPGSKARVVAHTPVALRYAAVATAGDEIVIAGGTVGTAANSAVYAFTPANHGVRRIARLPKPLTHSSAAALGGTVYLLGGRGPLQGTQTRRILAIDPRTGRVRKAGRLPRAVSDAGAATVPGGIVLAGGRDASGSVRGDVFKLVERR
jgi:N-acetylneuraminic acid mutarotase